ncbi:MAG TPA: rhomboid family intramembrane serine protease [Candidatus Hydrogenedentes bacterium]|nr:rhomboid family intramembrane serine protease [Candidatus Hydrogenedentota bacterium]
MRQFYEPEMRMSLQLPRITWAVQQLILLNVIIFALYLALLPLETGLALRTGSARLSLFYWLGFHPGHFYYGFLWTPLTYQFLHGGLLHLFMNMLWLFVFGPEVERVLGSRQFVRFYLACGALGVLATGIPYVLTGQYATVIGASGATMGVLVAFAMIDPERRFYMFPLPVPITAAWLVILVVMFNVVGLRAGDPSTSIATHFGGMIAGGALMKGIPLFNRWRREQMLYTDRPGKRPSDESERISKIGDAVDNIFRFKDDR